MDNAVSIPAYMIPTNKRKNLGENRGFSFGGDGGNRSVASFVCFANLSHLYVPFASQKMDNAVSIPAYIKKKTSAKTEVFLLVEMAVIETASENTFPQISTSVAVLF